MHVADLILQVIAVAVVAFVYSNVLTEGGMILCWWKNLLERLLLGAKRYREVHCIAVDAEIQGHYDLYWLYDPLIGCERCVAGQMAFWFYIYHNTYCWYEHLAVVCCTIFFVSLIKLLYIWINQKLNSLY